jgi:LPXTG-motif cell wall-anchored protein
MDHTTLSAMLFAVAGVLLVLLMARRRKRKSFR